MTSKLNDPPTREEIAALTRWGQVAFAARCALRVGPIFEAYWPVAGPEHVAAVREAAAAAAAAASDARETRAVVSSAYARASEAAADAQNAASADERAAVVAVRVAFVARAAAEAALSPASHSANAATAAGSVAAVVATFAGFPTGVIREDFLRLRSLTADWSDKTPVPQAVFGPMWPDGEPDWEELARKAGVKPAEIGEEGVEHGPHFLELAIDLPDDITDEEAKRIVRETILRVQQAYVGQGGSGLIKDDVKAFSPSEVLS